MSNYSITVEYKKPEAKKLYITEILFQYLKKVHFKKLINFLKSFQIKFFFKKIYACGRPRAARGGERGHPHRRARARDRRRRRRRRWRVLPPRRPPLRRRGCRHHGRHQHHAASLH
jgi:hypothetical protein